MSDPFIPVSSPNGLDVPWDMIMSQTPTWNPPRQGAPPIPNMPINSQPTMPSRQYPNRPSMQPYPQPYPTGYPSMQPDYNIDIDGTCEAKEVIVQCPISAVNRVQNQYAQPTSGTSPLSFFVG